MFTAFCEAKSWDKDQGKTMKEVMIIKKLISFIGAQLFTLIILLVGSICLFSMMIFCIYPRYSYQYFKFKVFGIKSPRFRINL